MLSSEYPFYWSFVSLEMRTVEKPSGWHQLLRPCDDGKGSTIASPRGSGFFVASPTVPHSTKGKLTNENRSFHNLGSSDRDGCHLGASGPWHRRRQLHGRANTLALHWIAYNCRGCG